MSILDTLDDLQKKAVLAKSPTLINAAAGSGKTRCLIAKIIHLIEQGASSDQICAITFTNKAANEMKKRLKDKVPLRGMQVSTIHSLCVRVIKTFIKHTYLKQPFSIYDDSDQLSIIKTVVKSKELPGDPQEYLQKISKIKTSLSENKLKGDLEIVYKSYQNILFKNNACDFDDLLVNAYHCLTNKDCANYFSDLWPHILVDEFQDTSVIQYNIISMMHSSKSQTLFVVGDYNQSIYGWRGAHPKNIRDFTDRFKPSICYLRYNYRCSQLIIQHANNFTQFGKPMIAKLSIPGRVSFSAFYDHEEEAYKIADAIQKLDSYEDTAIICRINARTILFERAFSQYRIPYKVIGSLPYYKRKVAKDLLAYIKASRNQSDLESLVRIVNTPKRGFGDKKKEQLLLKGWPYLYEAAQQMPKIDTLITLLNNIKDMEPSDAVEEILAYTGYRESLTRDNDLYMVDSFIDVAGGFDTLDELILASTFLEDDAGHGVKLLTAHSSKGLEFDNVFVVGVESGLWPHSRSLNIDEEKRLFYVACTRAKRALNISYSRTRMLRGNRINVEPSILFIDSYNAQQQ